MDFWDPHIQSEVDCIVEGEERWQSIGFTNGMILLVAHTVREEVGEEVIRIISARRALANERKRYEEEQG